MVAKLNGWIRLWIVVSACWLMFIGYFAYKDLLVLYGTKVFEVEKDSVGKAEFVFSASQSDNEIAEFIKTDLAPLLEKEPENYRGKVVKTPYDTYVRKHVLSKTSGYLKVAILPILALLVIGWSIAWVRRGFTEKTVV